MVGRAGFPYRAPTVPRGVDVPPAPRRTGADYETEWARRPLARTVRRAIVEGPLRLTVRAVASPEVVGRDRLRDLLDGEGDGEPSPAIFVANHESHLDSALMLTAIPLPWRAKLVVGAAADYFFGTRVTGAASALALGAFPIDRTAVNRRSADLATALLREGWSLLIFPEGGRSPDGWGQPFKGGAAFLAERTGLPVVPVHLDGTGAILGKGTSRLRPGRTKVTFGAPLRLAEGENVRRFGARIEAAVAVLADEAVTDWWSARRRAAQGRTPSLGGPGYGGWRRAWALTEHRARGKAGQRRRQKRTWPSLS
jgi:1-acyl-sn-glycerol-3-phosphate acyltransferase